LLMTRPREAFPISGRYQFIFFGDTIQEAGTGEG
jgi:hypothetical protein